MSDEEVVAEAQEADEEAPAEAAEEASGAEETQQAEDAPAQDPAPAESEEPAEAEPAEVEPEEERHPLSRERVIDLEKLLRPIPGDSPSGEYLRYHGIYDEIAEARRADEDLAMGAWQTDLKVADYTLTIQLATPVLEKQTKDLQIGAWLVEALVAQHGFAGMRDGLRLLTGFLNRFWETLYPDIEEGDQEGRANALAWVDREIGFQIKKAPITVDGWGYNGYLDSKKFDIPASFDGLSTDEQAKFNALKEQAERENRVTASKWEAAVVRTDRAFCEEVHVAILECEEEYTKLNAAIEQHFDRNQAPGLPEMRKALQEIKSQQNDLLELKRSEEPDPEDETAGEGDASGEHGETRRAGISGPISSRSDALKRLTEVAAFFRKTEPHSPVSYLVNRAIQWGNMPLENWLQDVIKDQNILSQLKQTLGFNTVADGSGAGNTESQGAEPPPQEQ